KNSIYGNNLEFARINTSLKINNTSNNTISSLKASKTLFRAYQFKPLLQFLNSENKRWLVADEGGLGKTIEAGHIMIELHARDELKNVLNICPKMLMDKWRTEMKSKFNFDFKIYQSKRELTEDIDNHRLIKGILNYEKIRSTSKEIKGKTTLE